jgi:hypothetical protein
MKLKRVGPNNNKGMSGLIQKALVVKRESKHIEFKQEFDTNAPQDWCEVIKDIIAIANSGGGIIVFGLDNVGIPTGASVREIMLIDPADISNKIARYTGAVDLEFEIHKLKKRRHELVAFVIQASSLPLVFEKPGTYDIGSGKQRTAFSVGTVYFRHGSKSEPGSSDDIRLVIQRQIKRQLEYMRKSWINSVRKVVKAPYGSQIFATLPARGAKASVSLSPYVRVVKDPKAIPVLLTRDPTIAKGLFVHEEVSDGIFDEINNVIDANRALARGRQSFFLGKSVYYRIYAERHHVSQRDNDVSLLLHSGVLEFYAPVLFWVLKLPEKLIAQVFMELYLRPKTPSIYHLMRIAVLLGNKFCTWLYDRWHSKWQRYPQPPSFYWTFQDMVEKMKTGDPRVIAVRTTPTSVLAIPGETATVVKELLDRPEQAASLLSRLCMRVFEGETALGTMARNIDYLVYGRDVGLRSKVISEAIIKIIGDKDVGDILELPEKD